MGTFIPYRVINGLVHTVTKKFDFTIVENEKNELVQIWLPTKIRVYIDYRKLNVATCKDHFPLPFIGQMLKRLAGHEYYYFLDGYSGYNQIPIAPEDQEKTTLHVHLGCLHTTKYLLDYAMPQQHSNVAC